MTPRRLGALFVLVAAGSACARIMGVEAPILSDDVDPAANGGDGGAGGSRGTLPVGGACARDNDCASLACIAGSCADCAAEPTDTCPAGRYCLLPSRVCAVGCKANSDCSSVSELVPFCDTKRHQCVACRDPVDCTDGTGTQCTPSGVCANRCTGADAGTCAPGQACCGDFCVDVKSDPLHCNGCGNACSGGSAVCCAGTCADALVSPENCGGCGLSCSTVNGAPTCAAGSCKSAAAQGEAACGAVNQPCCSSGGSGCQGTAYCADDKTCRPCKPQATSCAATKECCGGKVCQNNNNVMRCD